jgi:hypothetical protein
VSASSSRYAVSSGVHTRLEMHDQNKFRPSRFLNAIL